MSDKKNLCRYDDYIEPKTLMVSYHAPTSHSAVLTEFKLDKIFPKTINIKLNAEAYPTPNPNPVSTPTKGSETFKFFNNT
jgi:hypothetical protein